MRRSIDINLIDIASYQQGISLPVLYDSNPALNGVIVKVSEGTGYVNPCAKEWLDWLMENGKVAGTYHYLNLMGAEVEARHYVESVKPWLGKVTLAIDYEDTTLNKGTGYLKACLDEVYRLTGVKPFVYCSQSSALEAQNFTAIAEAGYPLWVAQYADYALVYGFLENPWYRGKPTPFSSYSMRQYTSSGRLNGWGKNLDFDKFYGTVEDWNKLCVGKSEPPVEPKKVDPVVVTDVLAGKYGIGSEREAGLIAAGYDPKSVQDKINELYGVAAKVKPLVQSNWAYINSILKIVKTMF